MRYISSRSRGLHAILIALWIVMKCNTAAATGTDDTKNNNNTKNISDVQLVSLEELQSKTNLESEIWLSILGDVYNVTAGDRFYGESGGYHFFAGKDGTLGFITGNFGEEQPDNYIELLQNLSEDHLEGLQHWAGFYTNHEEYNFVGKLVDGTFYKISEDDATAAVPTDLLLSITSKMPGGASDGSADEL